MTASKLHTWLNAAGAGLTVGAALAALPGCGQGGPGPGPPADPSRAVPATQSTRSGEEAEIEKARAALSPEDRRLVDAQDFCPVMEHNRLGVMGPPVKVTVKDRPVFLCCKGCRRKALADPDKTLAKVEELKARVKERKTTIP
jgi:predicted small lipoprotein YifL